MVMRMISATITTAKEFKNILSVAEAILTEIKLECDNDGIRFRGLDGSHTSFLEVNFNKSYFSDFRLEELDNIIIDASELNKIFKRIKNDDEITFKIGDDVLTIEVASETNEKTFKLNGIDMEYDSPRMPSIDYPVNVDVNFKEFKENVMDANLYENKLRIKVEDNNLVIFNRGLMGEYESKLKLEQEFEKQYISVFSMDLINRIFKLTTLSDKINISMGTDMPMLMMLSDAFEEINVKFLTAPRIESDE